MHSPAARLDNVLLERESALSCDVANCTVHLLRHEPAIRAASREISDLRQRSGQASNPLTNLDFFLGRIRLLPGNRPVLLLVRSADRIEGAIYLQERVVCGLPTGYFRGFDHLSGESSVIAPEPWRGPILQHALVWLLSLPKSRVAWATVNLGKSPANPPSREVSPVNVNVTKIHREHQIKLERTFEQTLSRFGRHTRRNLRYYRRRAEAMLDVKFHHKLTFLQSDEAIRQLSKASWHLKPPDNRRRLEAFLRSRPDYFSMGLETNGIWLGYMVGLRANGTTCVFRQMNHSGFARYSLSTVLRSYFLEHETDLGQTEVKFVNGTCFSFQRCCEEDTCLTVCAYRGILASAMIKWVAPRHNAPDHGLNLHRLSPAMRGGPPAAGLLGTADEPGLAGWPAE